MTRPAWATVGWLLLAACAPGRGPEPPLPDTGSGQEAPRSVLADEPFAPPADAAALGWMPLASTGVPAFRERYPNEDGRGVLIAILDSGIDPAVPGLGRTTTDLPKLLDVRDFSGEGRVPLREVRLRGDSLLVGGHWLAGAGRLRAVSVGGRHYGGLLLEMPLGAPPAADVNANGRVGDSLAVVVTLASDGWVLFADTDGDGTLADERPVRDYGVAQESFGWSNAAGIIPLSVAAKILDQGEAPPLLDLVFDTSGHGTHVAGIAAGHTLYGVRGFDGVAPGAQVLGLKISNDAKGGITVTGSMYLATVHAVEEARRRRMPLVVNLSFGVGNEAEGSAPIDQLLDSLAIAHPDVVFVVSAGNDGPAYSTVGFPGSARQVISVGAAYPGHMLAAGAPGMPPPDLMAFFSSRGGELARPDLVVPGLAYSTVPRWNRGDEMKDGTSMAAPYVSGLVASLASGLHAAGRPVDASRIRRALMASARPLPGATVLDQGAGRPDLSRAREALYAAGRPVPIVARVDGPALSEPDPAPGALAARADAAYIVADSGVRGPLERTFVLVGGAPGETYRLETDSPWIEAPAGVTITGGETRVPVRYRLDRLTSFGSFVGLVTAIGVDEKAGPAFRLLSTIIRPRPLRADTLAIAAPGGTVQRWLVRADSGRSFRVELLDEGGAPFLASLHEPGGMPWRGGHAALAGGDEPAAVFVVDGRAARGGIYQISAVPGPVRSATGALRISPAPIIAFPRRGRDSVQVTMRNPGPGAFSGLLRLGIVGAERGVLVAATGPEQLRYPFHVPAWAARVVVELAMEREQWPLFTDFGLSLEETGSGRLVAESPLNYAVGRLEIDADSLRSRELTVVLDPGFARPGARERWSGRLLIRLYADSAGASSDQSARPVELPAGAGQEASLLMPPVRLPLGSGFYPLGRLDLVQGVREWPIEVPLFAAPPPPMP